MITGKIAYYFEHKEIIPGICLSETEDRYHLLLSGSNEITLPKKRIIYLSSYTVDVKSSKEDQLRFAAEKTDHQKKLAQEICISALWESLDNKGKLYDISSLANIFLKSKTDSDRKMAVIRSIMNDGIHFKMKDSQFLSNTPEQVLKLKVKAEIEKQKQKEIIDLNRWLHSIIAEKEISVKNRDEYISYLKEYTIDGKDAACYSTIKNILKTTDLTTQKKCFDILVKAGVFDEDENILLQTHRIPCKWPESVIKQTEALIEPDIEKLRRDKSRKDLTGLNTFSIDDLSTRDIDDALSVEEHPGFFNVYIHIADAASFIPSGTPIELEAKNRGRSIYLPEEKIPMLPPRLSENILSLKQGKIRPAVSFTIKLSPDGEILAYSAQTSIIKNDRKMHYDETDIEINDNTLFRKLYCLALKLRGKRLAKGASSILLPELQLNVNHKKEIKIIKRERESKSQILVSEYMILANYCASLIFKDNDFPALYRTQAVPSEKPVQKETPSLFDLFSLKKKFGRVDIDTKAAPHSGLGLDSYTTLTSPLRKYLDFVTQRQLLFLLKGDKPDKDHTLLKNIVELTQPILTKASIVEQGRERYWLLKILQQNTGKKTEALVLGKKFKGYNILLIEYFMEINIKTPKETKLTPGKIISVIIKSTDPFSRILEVALTED